MKEIINSQSYKKGLLRKLTATAGMLIALNACYQEQIEDGTIYQKEHIKTEYALLGGKFPAKRQKIEREVISMPPTKEEIPEFSGDMFQRSLMSSRENWKVYIAKCPKGELPSQEKIEKECKTSSFDVSQEIFPALKIGQYADFKQTE